MLGYEVSCFVVASLLTVSSVIAFCCHLLLDDSMCTCCYIGHIITQQVEKLRSCVHVLHLIFRPECNSFNMLKGVVMIHALFIYYVTKSKQVLMIVSIVHK